jgi:HSP20 family protein
MAGLIPFNRKNNSLARAGAGFEDFYNMLDDFFSDSWLPGRSLFRDTFKIDIKETDSEYRVEAELPGIKKDEIDLGFEDENLCISVTRTEENNEEDKNYIHRERHIGSVSRRIRLANAKLNEIKAKLEDGVLTITIPKDERANILQRIEIE